MEKNLMSQITVGFDEARNRGFNLMATAVLVIAGVAFGVTGYQERPEVTDMLDDVALVLIGLAALLWYRFGGSRFRHTPTPLLMLVGAVATQVVGVLIERGDPANRGDNIEALLVLVPFLIVCLWEYVRPLASAQSGSSAVQLEHEKPGRRPAATD
jgi:hypothetical protein